jgi:hypothetical protein
MTVTANMLTAIKESGHTLGIVLTITLPSGLGAELGLPDDNLRLGSTPFCSSTAGPFDGRVVKFGGSNGSLSDANGNLQRWTVNVSISDLPETDAPVDRSIGPFGRAIKLSHLEGAPCVIQIAAKDVTPSDWWTERTGVLMGWHRDQDTDWILQIGPDDEALKRPAPRLKLTSQDWPAAYIPPKDKDQSVIGQYAPVILGDLDSTGLGEHGLRRTLLVDTAQNRYLVSLGTIGATGFRVFVDGVEQVSGWTREVIRQAGRTWTVITYGVALTDTQVVTVDCHGLDLGSYGTYTSPGAQFQWALEHLVFSNWNGADTLTPTHTDAASFSTLITALGTREGAPGWLTLGAEVSGEEMIRRFCVAHGVEVGWTPEGTITAKLLNPMALDVDATTNVVIQGQHTVGRSPLQLLTPPTEDLWQAVSMNYLQGPDGKGVADLSVYHPRHLDAAPRAIVNQWGPGRVL